MPSVSRVCKLVGSSEMLDRDQSCQNLQMCSAGQDPVAAGPVLPTKGAAPDQAAIVSAEEPPTSALKASREQAEAGGALAPLAGMGYRGQESAWRKPDLSQFHLWMHSDLPGAS